MLKAAKQAHRPSRNPITDVHLDNSQIFIFLVLAIVLEAAPFLLLGSFISALAGSEPYRLLLNPRFKWRPAAGQQAAPQMPGVFMSVLAVGFGPQAEHVASYSTCAARSPMPTDLLLEGV